MPYGGCRPTMSNPRAPNPDAPSARPVGLSAVSPWIRTVVGLVTTIILSEPRSKSSTNGESITANGKRCWVFSTFRMARRYRSNAVGVRPVSHRRAGPGGANEDDTRFPARESSGARPIPPPLQGAAPRTPNSPDCPRMSGRTRPGRCDDPGSRRAPKRRRSSTG